MITLIIQTGDHPKVAVVEPNVFAAIQQLCEHIEVGTPDTTRDAIFDVIDFLLRDSYRKDDVYILDMEQLVVYREQDV